jgi:hypothetical protein
MSARPTLVVNPASDRIFGEFAEMLVDHGVRSPEEMEIRLRSVYPEASVHRRELASEPRTVWYVYRDGHWVDKRRPAAREAQRSDV